MAIKKSDLYSSLWASCDQLRGGMDASQYKDYVLFLLFIKYISDKYGNSDDFSPPVTIPPGASFKDMVALKGKSDIGDKINTQVIQPLIDANAKLARSDFPNFNDPEKLGEGPALVERLSNLIGIFQNPVFDFSQNRAEHDDILGDAYEYLMRNFASESGKSKGQFYTPSEVSRVIAKVIGIGPGNTVASTTAYDPTCGSGSLLLKVAAHAWYPKSYFQMAAWDRGVCPRWQKRCCHGWPMWHIKKCQLLPHELNSQRGCSGISDAASFVTGHA